jgi:pimeloyl-ACP methyl ester carboxylesterase
MRKFLLIALLLFTPLHFANAESGFVKLPAGHDVYVDYQEAKPGQPTYVLINGLVYDLGRWDSFAAPLANQGAGILRYYFRGQMDTLRRELKNGRADFFDRGISRADLALELSQTLNALKINKAVVVGLSYGAGIAAEFGLRYPSQVERLVFLAPLVISLDKYDANGAWINWNLETLRIMWGPFWGPVIYDTYYNWIYRNYMNERLSSDRIPAAMQDVSAAYKEALFHQVRAMRDFDLRGMRFPGLEGKVDLLLAQAEETPALKDQFRVWNGLGKFQGNLVYFSPAWHAIPDAIGNWSAEIVSSLVNSDRRFKQGETYYSVPSERWNGIRTEDVKSLEEKALSEPRQAIQ